VDGPGTHLNSRSIKRFLAELMARGYRRFCLDLGDCTQLDSTFLGVITGACLQLRRSGGGRFALRRVGARNLELLRTLGVATLFDLEPPGGESDAEVEMEPLSASGRVTESGEATRRPSPAEPDGSHSLQLREVMDCLESGLRRRRERFLWDDKAGLLQP
jgi:anti-anti-sigma regulatory factor